MIGHHLYFRTPPIYGHHYQTFGPAGRVVPDGTVRHNNLSRLALLRVWVKVQEWCGTVSRKYDPPRA